MTAPDARPAAYTVPGAQELTRLLNAMSKTRALAPVREGIVDDLAGRRVTGIVAANTVALRYWMLVGADPGGDGAPTMTAVDRGELAFMLSAVLETAPFAIRDEAHRHLAAITEAHVDPDSRRFDFPD